MSYSTTIIVGNLGRDPELRYTPSGDPVCNFSVAVSRRWTDKSGVQQEDTTWYAVSVFGRQAEPCSRYLAKGRQVLVEGDVKARGYTRGDGTAGVGLDLRARSVQFLGGRDGSSEQTDFLDEAPERRSPPVQRTNLNDDDPDIPF